MAPADRARSATRRPILRSPQFLPATSHSRPSSCAIQEPVFCGVQSGSLGHTDDRCRRTRQSLLRSNPAFVRMTPLWRGDRDISSRPQSTVTTNIHQRFERSSAQGPPSSPLTSTLRLGVSRARISPHVHSYLSAPSRNCHSKSLQITRDASFLGCTFYLPLARVELSSSLVSY